MATKTKEDYSKFEKGSDEIIERLVQDHMGWATAIAKSVARAWNLDWQLDGLDGGAYEGLLFCAGRFDPTLGIPFRAYARRRIHEASTEEARKSKTWKRGTGGDAGAEESARELSAKLFNVFPELHEGLIPAAEGKGEDGVRASMRQLLMGASLLSAFQESSTENPENVMEYKQVLGHISDLEPVHQWILWSIYWQGKSMRSLAAEWELDDLSVIREHKVILDFLGSLLAEERMRKPKKPKVRRGLKNLALKLRKEEKEAPFARFAAGAAVVMLCLAAASMHFSKLRVLLTDFYLS